ncbi:MAG TPA: MFS transporter [Jiangellales bacterium]|nr:MFS transporter [Jiangellales bacterium]
MAVFGYWLFAFGPTVPLLREDQGVSRAVSGLHGTALAAGSVLAGLFGAALVARLGRATVMRLGLVGIAVAVVLITSATALPVTLLGALVGGTLGSLLVNTHSPVLSDHHELAGPAAINEANALAAAAGVLSPLVLGLCVASGLGWRVGLLAVVPLAAVGLVYSRGVRMPDPAPSRGLPPGARPRLPRRYWASWTVFVLCIAVEFSMTIWASVLLRERAGLSAGAAAASVSLLVLGMSVGRLLGGRLALRVPVDLLLGSSLLVTLAGFAAFWASTSPWLAVGGLLVVGLGVAVQFPLAVTRAIAASRGLADVATARASLGAGLAIGVAPFALGSLADRVGTHRAYLIVPGLLVLAGAVLLADVAYGQRPRSR